jgi:hypothetical protein
MPTSVSKYVTYETDGVVGIWSIEDMPAAIREADIERAEEHFLRVGGAPLLRSAVVEVGGLEQTQKEVLFHVSDMWAELMSRADVEAVAIVGDKPQMQKINDNIDPSIGVIEPFESRPDAIAWAKEQHHRLVDE